MSSEIRAAGTPPQGRPDRLDTYVDRYASRTAGMTALTAGSGSSRSTSLPV